MEQHAQTIGQKRKFLARLYKIWRENPDLRFGQLIENLFHRDDHYLYSIEDERMISDLEQFYVNMKKN